MSGLGALRRFTAAVERCDLCGESLTSGHDHLLDPRGHTRCACRACALLLPRLRRAPRRVELSLHDALPVELVFVYRKADGQLAAWYPSPAGPVACELELAAWGAGVLDELEKEVEGVLVRGSEAFRVGLDDALRLLGLVRTHWRGLGGGERVRLEIERFFEGLRT